jgi:hypothetical protein
MKKTIYTLAFVALLSVMAKSQSATEPKKAEPVKKETVNPDGTIAPVQGVQDEKPAQAQEPKKSGTRMAITEKGVPASKSTDSKSQKAAEPKKTEPAKTEKH